MLTNEDYLQVKQRLLVATELLHRVCTSPDTVQYDEEYYPIVLAAGLSAQEDICKVLAELDILRSRFTEGLFTLGITHNAETEGTDSAGTVGTVPPQTSGASSSGKRDEPAEAGGDSEGDGANGEQASRPNPRRNSRSRRRNQTDAVGRGDTEGEVGGGTDD